MSTADIDTFEPRSWLLRQLRRNGDTQGDKYRELLDQFTEDEDWMLSRVCVHKDDGRGQQLTWCWAEPVTVVWRDWLGAKADYCLHQAPAWDVTTATAREAANVLGRYLHCVRKKEKQNS